MVRRDVVFRYVPKAGETALSVDLLGEPFDWLTPRPLARNEDGAFQRVVALPLGVYAYKLVVDGQWRLDPTNPRTRSSGGARNSVVVVGGADEPFLHAPAPPFLEELDRGGVRLLVGVRKPEGPAPSLMFTEDEGVAPALVPMARAFEEDEHVFYEATVPASAARLHYRITRASPEGEQAAGPFLHTRTAAADRTPSWWRDAVVYTVFVDRFRPAQDHAHWERELPRGAPAGGHLEGIRRSLGELQTLGVTTLYLTPVHVGESAHRYDLVDPFAVDPALGGEDAYRRLVEDLHQRGMTLLQDFSFAHAGKSFPQAADVMARGRASPFAGWFLWSGDTLRHYGRRTDAPLLDLEHPHVQDLVLRTVEAWAKRGIDGFRLDMTAEVPFDLGRRIRQRLRQLRPHAVVVGEVVPAHRWRWRVEGVVDAATDFSFHGAATELAATCRLSPRAFVERLRTAEACGGGDLSTSALRFLSTHDHVRFATRAAHEGHGHPLDLGYVLLATSPGVPALLYGEEVGLRAPPRGDLESELENVWPDRAPMPWRSSLRDEGLRERLQRLFTLRRDHPALRGGIQDILHADEHLLVYRRREGGDVVDVAMNLGPEAAVLALDDDERPARELLFASGGATLEGGELHLPPRSALVLERRPSARGMATGGERIRRNLVLLEHEFAEGRAAVGTRPTRLDFAVTERCNLRCQHCITLAPTRTQEGTARTLSPAILDALRDDLGHAHYFGFVHGGESLSAPIFFDVLTAIGAARGPEPYVAHLLTNGVLLTEATTKKLWERGVTSLSVSLDGATAAVNDAIREGGRFDAIVENLRAASALRRREGWDLRLGLSFVILAQNLHELVPFVDLAAELGVDWVKVEEGVAATPFARRSLVQPGATEVAEKVAAAVARAQARGLVAVDHTRTPPIWRCRLSEDPVAKTFVDTDEFANRSHINPCLAPWEVACIEPNGDVRMGEFFGPLLGNLLREPLSALWNGPAARDERERSRRARVCGSGPVTCRDQRGRRPA